MSRRSTQFSALCLLLFIIGAVQGQENSRYRLPPQTVVDVLSREPTPGVLVDPNGRFLVLEHRSGMPGIADVSQPFLRLAGRRINPRTNGPRVGRLGRINSLTVMEIAQGKSTKIEIPQDANLGFLEFSPDGKRLLFTHTASEGVELWVSELETGRSQRLLGPTLNATQNPCVWVPGSKVAICRTVPSNRGDPPPAAGVPIGPQVVGSRGEKAQVRTYQDLLKSPYDARLFDYYLTSQLVQIDVKTGTSKDIGKPGVFNSFKVSPSGEYLLVDRVVRPYSYAVPQPLFPKKVEVWSLDGEAVRTLATLPLAETVPIGGVRQGPRKYSWRSTSPASLVWVEALDEGNPKKEAAYRDKIMIQDAPFESAPRELFQTEYRFSRVQWGEHGRAFVAEYDRDKQWTRTWLLESSNRGSPSPQLLFDRNAYDAYGDPGRFVTTLNDSGHSVVYGKRSFVYLTGRGSSATGDHPFLDRLDVKSRQTERLFRSEEGSYEQVISVLNEEGPKILTRFETNKETPNYFERDLATGTRRRLTQFEDPAPELRGINKSLVTYWREDGIELSGTLYLPENYREGERLPLVMWAYPREYNDPKVASQVRGSPDRFVRISGPSHLFFLTQGYAVLDGPAMPIVGKEGNDTFVEQLVMNAKAAIDKVVEMGVADRKRIGIGGHSYGAFMTANLLAHSDFFSAGIARSGAYNRTLTPFGFQNERRTLWEAPETYFAMSPFMHADQINEPLLLIHGAADNNSGTFPIQSQRLFHALKGLGGTVRLVVLPDESHGYAARESVMDVLAEMIDWFDRYVKRR